MILFFVLVALACGLKDSVRLNNLFTLVNCAIILAVIIGGSFNGNNCLDKYDLGTDYGQRMENGLNM